MNSKLLTLLLLLVVSHVNALAGLRAGIAVRKVNPDPLLPVSGGIGPSHPVNRREGDLTVRALVLEQEGTLVAIVSADFLGFPAVLGNRVRAAVKEIPAQNILIGATHTHSAPDCYGFPDGAGGTARDEKYMELVCARMAEALHEAVTNLQPVRLKIATGEAKGKIAYNYYAEQLYDPRCHVIQALDASGKPIATLVNYAIHPEVLGNDAGICSPDLVGPLYERVAEKGGGTVYGLVREYPIMSSLTRCSEKMWVSFSASPDAFRSVFCPPETKGPKSNLAAAAGGVGMQQPLCPL
jgi:hypothetical protein